jgi:GNAT superfamily N-acetyltransferase
MIIRRFTSSDAQETSAMIAETLRTSNINDYTPELMEQCVAHLSAENLVQRSDWLHFYVVVDGDKIIGCGGIGPYWDKFDESSLFTVFVKPDQQGKGVGRLIMETLENDEFFLRAKRVEIPSSITAVNFYKKFGYDHKPGFEEPDEEQIYRLEKYR